MWDPILAVGCRYEVSDDGRVRNAKTKHELAQQVSNRGYAKVFMMDMGKSNAFYVHRLVAYAFCPRPEDPNYSQVNHKNENKLDNRAENLEWVTPSQNINYGTALKRRVNTTSYPIVMSLNGVDVCFKSAHEAEERTGIPAKSIQKCCAGKLKSTHGATFRYAKEVW